jgi:hypothetical protein
MPWMHVNERLLPGTVAVVGADPFADNVHIVVWNTPTADPNAGWNLLLEGRVVLVVAVFDVETHLTTRYNVAYMIVSELGVGYYVDEDLWSNSLCLRAVAPPPRVHPPQPLPYIGEQENK